MPKRQMCIYRVCAIDKKGFKCFYSDCLIDVLLIEMCLGSKEYFIDKQTCVTKEAIKRTILSDNKQDLFDDPIKFEIYYLGVETINK